MKYEFRVSFDSDEERDTFVRALHGATACLFARKTPEDSEKAVAILTAGVKAELAEVDAVVFEPINPITPRRTYSLNCENKPICERLICDCEDCLARQQP